MRVIFISLSLLLSACTMVAPAYQPSIDNTQALRHANVSTMNVGKFVDTEKTNKISMRGSSMVSPFNKSYGEYIANALKLELQQAKLLSADSKIEIQGELVSNDVDVSGFSTGEGEISVKFVVMNQGQVTFDKVVSVTHSWDSSFMGAIAIPNGQINYPVMLQMLFEKLFKDEEFIQVIKT